MHSIEPPGSEGVRLFIKEPVTGSVHQREREEPESDGVGGDPFELDHITLR